MTFPTDLLQSLGSQPLGTVVHVGAGSVDVVHGYAALRPSRLVLIEGDADAAFELQEQVGSGTAFEAVTCAVAPQSGRIRWHRYNLSMLNGPLDATGLRAVYPRLRRMETVEVDAVALHDVLTERVSAEGGAPANVLVMDVPGQEDCLLASLPGDVLRRFGWIVLRGCSAYGASSWPKPQDAVDRLYGEGYALVESGAEPEPVWPVSLLRFDAAMFEFQLVRARLAESETLCGTRAATIERQTQELADLERALAALQKGGEEHAALIDRITKERDEQTRLAGERQMTIDALVKEKAEVTAERDTLTKEKTMLVAASDEQAKLARERQTQIDASATEKSQIAAEWDALTKEKPTLIAAREEQAKLARDARQRAAQLEAELAELSARHELLQEELIKVEAQVELMADLLLREPQA
jgi:FkbM family methyltransferase